LKTDKGDQKLFKPRIAKLMTEGGAVINLHAADVQKEGLYLNFTFPIEDTKAKVVVQTKINPLDHKILIIDEIHAIGVEGLDGHFIPHAKKNTDPSLKTGIRLGNGMVRQMLDFIVAEVKMSFPNIEKITGKRQTGARAKFKTTTAATAQIS
jgi:hypothetical protein